MDPESDAAGALAALRGAQDRSFRSEGIPMVLALQGPAAEEPVAVRHEAARAEGPVLAEGLDRVRGALFPTRRDGDMGCVISTLQAFSVDAFLPDARS